MIAQCVGPSDLSWSIKSFFYENSIFHAMENEHIEREKCKNKNASLIERIKIGIYYGLKSVTRAIVLATLVTSVCLKPFNLIKACFKSIDLDKKISSPSFFSVVITAPVLEEIFFRGILQNGISLLQQALRGMFPTCLRKNHVFAWLTSASFRIVVTQVFFAGAHLLNAGSYLTLAEAIVQVALHFFNPIQSILHETTGDIIAPLAAHFTNNLIFSVL